MLCIDSYAPVSLLNPSFWFQRYSNLRLYASLEWCGIPNTSEYIAQVLCLLSISGKTRSVNKEIVPKRNTFTVT